MVIGCGYIGRQHLEDIYYRDNICVEAVADQNPAAARFAAEKYRAARWGTDYRKLLAEARPDIAVIATNADSHLSILRDCLQAGVHVLCEKPIARTLSDAGEFAELVRRAEACVLVGHILRHNRTFIRAGELIRAGAVGMPLVIRIVKNQHALDWARYRRLLRDCLPVTDCGVHYFDIMEWYTGEHITELSGIGAVTEPDVPEGRYNYTLSAVRLSGGSVGYFEAGWGRSMAQSNVKEFIGPKGRLVIELAADRGAFREEGDLITIYHSDTGEYQSISSRSSYKPMYAQLSHLIAMIEGRAGANPSMEQVMASHRAADAAARAIYSGQPVRLTG